ncbi:MAG: aspartate ammonia-lyase [Caldithrix sp.]|nr:aspartate ammonia-lyase [Caldithrix sp.]
MNEIEEEHYQTGQFLFKENMPREKLFLIYQGEIELLKKSALGEEKRLGIFKTYDFLGEGALMDAYPHSTSSRALVDTKVFVLKAKKFTKLFENQPALAGKILAHVARVISRRMRQTTSQVVDIAAQYISGRTRQEHDLLGERYVPHEYYYGIQTLRALENFSISGVPLMHFPLLIESLAMVKMAAAKANLEIGLLSKPVANAIIQACTEIMNGKFHTQFVVDMIQGGAGTSTNMNANEVIANRALEILGYEKGQYTHCHPNNHVNLSQSTNDVYPTALKIALINSNRKLTGVLKDLVDAIRQKADTFKDIIKMGRTQLQDAVPMTLGQEFGAYAATLQEEIERLQVNADLFLEVNLGGTAIGTGINADPKYSVLAIDYLKTISKLNVKLAPDLVEATQDTGAFVMYSSALKRLAIKLSKMSSDLRLLSSGPRAGFHEINLPKMQPGSSIMPGKVNPVIPEVVNQITYKVIGNDLTVSMAAEAGQLELNVMEPIIAQSIFESIEMLKNGMATLHQRCIEGITANEARTRQMVENSIGLVTALNPVLGYEVCSSLASEALQADKSVYDLVLQKKLLTKEELDRLILPENMIGPNRLK